MWRKQKMKKENKIKMLKMKRNMTLEKAICGINMLIGF